MPEGEKHVVMEHFTDQVIQQVCLGERPDLAWATEIAAPLTSEVVLSGNMILNVVIPAAMASVMGYASIDDAAAEAEKAAYITAGIPGPKMAAKKAAKLACEIYRALTGPECP